ncbi:hypothetical protein E4U53_005779 [Claviceps sorghi]|nr:hypothetical protein E4U53_005779 [Claviceps sorghi]
MNVVHGIETKKEAIKARQCSSSARAFASKSGRRVGAGPGMFVAAERHGRSTEEQKKSKVQKKIRTKGEIPRTQLSTRVPQIPEFIIFRSRRMARKGYYSLPGCG